MTPIVIEETTLAGAAPTNGHVPALTAASSEATLAQVLALLQAQDERRQDLEEVVSDLLPAINGAIRLAVARLDALEKSGVLELLPLAGATLEALKRPSQIAPVKPLQLLRALRDPDVGRGLGVMLEVLRAIGAAAGKPAASTRS